MQNYEKGIILVGHGSRREDANQEWDEIWKNSQLFQTLRTQAYKGSCGTCGFKSVCGGCRARSAYYHDGDILAEDTYCAYGQNLSHE